MASLSISCAIVTDVDGLEEMSSTSEVQRCERKTVSLYVHRSLRFCIMLTNETAPINTDCGKTCGQAAKYWPTQPTSAKQYSPGPPPVDLCEVNDTYPLSLISASDDSFCYLRSVTRGPNMWKPTITSTDVGVCVRVTHCPIWL